MYAAFLAPSVPPAVSTPSRAARKTLRLSTPRPAPTDPSFTSALPEAVDKYFQTSYRVDPSFLVNLETAGEHADAFNDIDNEYEGLTITEPMNEADLWRFCTGYDVL